MAKGAKTKHPELQNAFGRAVRTARKVLDISQEELADACDLDRTYVGGIERGERNPSLVNIWRLAAALEISTGALFALVEKEFARD